MRTRLPLGAILLFLVGVAWSPPLQLGGTGNPGTPSDSKIPWQAKNNGSQIIPDLFWASMATHSMDQTKWDSKSAPDQQTVLSDWLQKYDDHSDKYHHFAEDYNGVVKAYKQAASDPKMVDTFRDALRGIASGSKVELSIDESSPGKGSSADPLGIFNNPNLKFPLTKADAQKIDKYLNSPDDNWNSIMKGFEPAPAHKDLVSMGKGLLQMAKDAQQESTLAKGGKAKQAELQKLEQDMQGRTNDMAQKAGKWGLIASAAGTSSGAGWDAARQELDRTFNGSPDENGVIFRSRMARDNAGNFVYIRDYYTKDQIDFSDPAHLKLKTGANGSVPPPVYTATFKAPSGDFSDGVASIERSIRDGGRAGALNDLRAAAAKATAAVEATRAGLQVTPPKEVAKAAAPGAAYLALEPGDLKEQHDRLQKDISKMSREQLTKETDCDEQAAKDRKELQSNLDSVPDVQARTAAIDAKDQKCKDGVRGLYQKEYKEKQERLKGMETAEKAQKEQAEVDLFNRKLAVARTQFNNFISDDLPNYRHLTQSQIQLFITWCGGFPNNPKDPKSSAAITAMGTTEAWWPDKAREYVTGLYDSYYKGVMAAAGAK